MDRPTSEYAQSGSHHHPSSTDTPSEQPADQTPAAAAPAHYTPPDVKYTPQPEVRPTNTPQPEYGLNPPPTRSPAYQEYLPRPQPYAPSSQPGGAPPGMAQTSSLFLPAFEARSSPNIKSDAVIDPSLPANSPTYPPPYSPYQPQGHEMAQYQGHPPPPHQMYARPDWPHSYAQQHHMPGPYASPATTVGSASPAATVGPRPGQGYVFDDSGGFCSFPFILDASGLGLLRNKPASQGSSETAHFVSSEIKNIPLAN